MYESVYDDLHCIHGQKLVLIFNTLVGKTKKNSCRSNCVKSICYALTLAVGKTILNQCYGLLM